MKETCAEIFDDEITNCDFLAKLYSKFSGYLLEHDKAEMDVWYASYK